MLLGDFLLVARLHVNGPNASNDKEFDRLAPSGFEGKNPQRRHIQSTDAKRRCGKVADGISMRNGAPKKIFSTGCLSRSSRLPPLR